VSIHACIVIAIISYWPAIAESRSRYLGRGLDLAGLSSSWILVSVACGPSECLSYWIIMWAVGLRSSVAWLRPVLVAAGVSAALMCLGLLT
jgi:hypothetical protein